MFIANLMSIRASFRGKNLSIQNDGEVELSGVQGALKIMANPGAVEPIGSECGFSGNVKGRLGDDIQGTADKLIYKFSANDEKDSWLHGEGSGLERSNSEAQERAELI
jgi:hypothetical protein